MDYGISHNREEESLHAKLLWFQSLSMTERMDLLCEFTDLIFENNPNIADLKDNAQQAKGRVCVLTKTSLDKNF